LYLNPSQRGVLRNSARFNVDYPTEEEEEAAAGTRQVAVKMDRERRLDDDDDDCTYKYPRYNAIGLFKLQIGCCSV